jgi:hypothetical protein
VEITGWDTVIFTVTPPRVVFGRVVATVLSRWPMALVEGLGPADTRPEVLASTPNDRFPNGPGHPIFYRDAAIARHMEDHAYVPMADGDGPFAVFVRERVGIEFELSGLNELRAADHNRSAAQPPAPYHAWLCSPLVIEVTAVTPGNPATHPFSSWVLAEVKRACREAELGAAPDCGGGPAS